MSMITLVSLEHRICVKDSHSDLALSPLSYQLRKGGNTQGCGPKERYNLAFSV